MRSRFDQQLHHTSSSELSHSADGVDRFFAERESYFSTRKISSANL